MVHFQGKLKFIPLFLAPMAIALTVTTPWVSNKVQAQTQANNPASNSPMTIRSDIQEANSETGVMTARGNVQINYPARNIQATSAQAQYFSRERRLVLTGNVYVLQNGNSMRSETMTYLIDEGRFIATPRTQRQVESIYIVTDNEPTSNPVTTPPTKRP